MTYHITSGILGLILGITILWLIRRDHLHSRHALWWLLVALMIMFLGFFPTAIDWVASHLGVNYPPTLLFVFGMGMILIKVINIDLHQSDLERKIRCLAQQLAILEGEIYEQEKGKEKSID
jgi:hypothetical protein